MDGATTLTLTREKVHAPAVAPTCGTCGETDSPDGSCLNVGACSRVELIVGIDRRVEGAGIGEDCDAHSSQSSRSCSMLP